MTFLPILTQSSAIAFVMPSCANPYIASFLPFSNRQTHVKVNANKRQWAREDHLFYAIAPFCC
ncbi:hypothetical protein WKK05_02620 [Nostoc sp. UHCC 0302]|uniref:hypothetical protein n=1 Tax=Nostoc sp. UHCC 0302 TaxID=3134896 RepID=UPI00311CC14C